HQTDSQRCRSGDAFLTAEQCPTHHLAVGYAERQHAHWLQCADHPDVGVWIEELGGLRADREVGLVDEIHCATGDHAVQCGDDRLPDLVCFRSEQRSRVFLIEDRQVVPPRPLGNIDAGAECALTVGAYHGDSNVVVVTHTCPYGDHLFGHLLVEAVE